MEEADDDDYDEFVLHVLLIDGFRLHMNRCCNRVDGCRASRRIVIVANILKY